MEWYYSQEGQQKGPLSQQQFDELTLSGVVSGSTLVWREGLPEWKPYSTISPSSFPPPSVGGDLVVCAECGRGFPKNETVQIEGAHVCAGCKPLFLQKLREGIVTGPGSAMWRSKRQLVTSLDATLPRRCIKCNASTEGDAIKRKLYWHPPAVYAALLLNVIIYVILAMAMRKRGVAFVSVCRPHRSARRNVILVGWLLAVIGFVAMIAGIANESWWIGIAGGLAMLGGIIYGMVRGRLIYAGKIDKDRMWLNGCGEDFLASFPTWTGPV